MSPKKKTGSVFRAGDGWKAQVPWRDPETGERRYLIRRRVRKSDAQNELEKMLEEAAQLERGGRPRRHGVTFDHLAKFYTEHYAIDVVEDDRGRKIEGLRTAREVRGQIARALLPHFKGRRIEDITFADVKEYRRKRLATPVYGRSEETKDTPIRSRSLASVHRELATLRRMLRIAKSERWLERSPFDDAPESLVRTRHERKRNRVVSLAEEQRLLAQFEVGERRHWRAFVLFLLDTGARRGEVQAGRLRWSDVRLEDGFAVIDTLKSEESDESEGKRAVALTARLTDALREQQRICEAMKRAGQLEKDDDSVFGYITQWSYRPWRSACADAGIVNLRPHDLRHTIASRLSARGLSLAHIGRILGHGQESTTWRYANVDLRMQKIAVGELEAYLALDPSDDPALNLSVVN